MKPIDGRIPTREVVCKYNKVLTSIFAPMSIYTDVYFMYVRVNIR
jgi:hypothetical protein